MTEHSITFITQHGTFEEMFAWCRDNIKHEWQTDVETPATAYSAGAYTFWFNEEKDMTAFCLKWQ